MKMYSQDYISWGLYLNVIKIYKMIKRTIRNLKKLIFFLPVVWKTEDWDYTYGVELFIKQLEYLKKGINKRDEHESKSHIIDEIDTFIDMYRTYERRDIHFKEYVEIQKLGVSEKERVQAYDEYTYLRNCEREELYNYLRDNLEKWWD